jgi:hypothetical protein
MCTSPVARLGQNDAWPVQTVRQRPDSYVDTQGGHAFQINSTQSGDQLTSQPANDWRMVLIECAGRVRLPFRHDRGEDVRQDHGSQKTPRKDLEA